MGSALRTRREFVLFRTGTGVILRGLITLLLATRNAHKIGEIRAVLGDRVGYSSLKDYTHAPEVIEDAATFAGNATKKAVALAAWIASMRNTEHGTRKTSPLFVLADDSGLEVDALAGAPGVHSARFAALDSGEPGNSSDADNNAKLLRLLQDVPREKRTARFRCVLALTPVLTTHKQSASPVCYANELELTTELFEGFCDGVIAYAPFGNGGFGYDPLFVPEGFETTFGELGEAVKNQMSHRAAALVKLKAWLIRESAQGPGNQL